MHINESSNSTWGWEGVCVGGVEQECEQAFLIIQIEVHSQDGQHVDCSICMLAPCNLGNIKFKTFRIYTSIEIILWREKFITVTAYAILKCLFCALSDWSLIWAAFGAVSHFLLPDPLSSFNVWGWLLLLSFLWAFLTAPHLTCSPCLLNIIVLGFYPQLSLLFLPTLIYFYGWNYYHC